MTPLGLTSDAQSLQGDRWVRWCDTTGLTQQSPAMRKGMKKNTLGSSANVVREKKNQQTKGDYLAGSKTAHAL